MYSLGLFYRLRHGQEDAVEQNGRHDDVVEIRVRRQVNGDSPHRIPRRKEEAGTRGGESMDVILAEPVRHHHKRLHLQKRYNIVLSGSILRTLASKQKKKSRVIESKQRKQMDDRDEISLVMQSTCRENGGNGSISIEARATTRLFVSTWKLVIPHPSTGRKIVPHCSCAKPPVGLSTC